VTKKGQAPLGHISARLRDEDYPLSNTKVGIRVNYNQLVVTTIELCDHTSTICESPMCIESWGLNDWQLFLTRTKMGRQFIKKWCLSDEDLAILEQKTRPSVRRLPTFTVTNGQAATVSSGPRIRINTTKEVF
jgi:hypothetical protein